MWAYLFRRLLWMIPTFLGILVINFAVIRLQAPSLSDQLSQGGGSGDGMGGERSADERLANVEQYIGRFRRAGNHLPAVINLRGFTDAGDVLEELKRTERGPDELQTSKRLRAETDLWMRGHFYVEPLVEILRRDELREYHGPASEALRLNSYVPPDEVDREVQRGHAEPADVDRVRSRRDFLRKNTIAYTNTEAAGYVTHDPDYESKRAAILAWYEREGRQQFGHGVGRALGAVVQETGFVDIMTKLFTGQLYSFSKQRYVFDLIGERWYVTFWLNIVSLCIAWGISIPLGIRSARRRGSLEDKVTTNTLFFLWSIPSFFVGTLLLHHLCTDSSTGVQLFPNAGLVSEHAEWFSAPRFLLDLAWHGFLPLVVLTYASFTALSRYMRGNMLDQLHADYVRTARAKGADEDRVIYGHALRNSMVTMITLGSGLIADLYGGFLFVEIIFSIQGLGLLMYQAALDTDAPLIMGSTVVSVGLLLISILVADIMYAVVDPRIRSRYA